MKKRIVMIMTAIMMVAGGMYAPVSAQVVDDVNQTTEAKEQAEAQAGTKEEKKEESADKKEESTPNKEDALTPDGNMTLVDNVTSSSGSKQFLTLTSRDGNFYYLIIDHDKDGNENVHFLNQVDERDLMGLMEDKEAKQVEDEIAEKEAAAAAEKALQNQTQTSSAKADADKTPAVQENSKKKTVAAIGLVVLFAAGAAGFFVLKKKKDAEPEKEDPDANYQEDEFGVELDMMDDEDFEDMDET